MPETIYMENRGVSKGVEHNKFYKVIFGPNDTATAYWGSIGAHEYSKVYPLEKALKKIKECERKGYVRITEGTTSVEARPESTGRFYGAEIEFNEGDVAPNTLAERMTARNLRTDVCLSYHPTTGNSWEIKRDGSCGFELASPKLQGDAGIFDAKVALTIMHELNTPVNQRCGMHVTVDISDHSDKDFKRLVIGLAKAQHLFYDKCASYRSSNRYCMPWDADQVIARVLKMSSKGAICSQIRSSDRYQGFNFSKSGRLEFRMMESSIAVRKVAAWIRQCVSFVDGLKQSQVTFNSTSKFTLETFEKICQSSWRLE